MNELDWEELVREHLVSSGAASGIAVLTKTGSCVYSYGLLATYNAQQNWKHFSDLFADTSHQSLETVPKFHLSLEQDVSFVTVQRTHSSSYATSANNMNQLVVCGFPLGVLVCVSQPPTPMSKTVTAVEHLCSKMRRY